MSILASHNKHTFLSQHGGVYLVTIDREFSDVIAPYLYKNVEVSSETDGADLTDARDTRRHESRLIMHAVAKKK